MKRIVKQKNIQNLEKIIKGVTQEHLDNDVNVEIISAYGGMTCWKGKISKVLEVLEDKVLIIHNSFDGREAVEWANEIINKSK